MQNRSPGVKLRSALIDGTIASGCNRFYVNVMEDFADDTPLTLTLRELRALAVSARFWAVLAGVIAILSLGGPFNTYSAFALPTRVAYWTLIATGSFGIGILVSTIVTLSLEHAGLDERLALLCGALTASLPITGLIACLQWAFHGDAIAAQFLSVLPYVSVISVIVAFLYELAGGGSFAPAELAERTARAEVERAPVPRLISKLPAGLGTDIIHLQAQDHYLKVTTTRGSALVLMSLIQAEHDLRPIDGLRVHRSWWVRRRHVERLVRKNGRLFLAVRDGQTIPVGRAYRSRVLAAFGNN